MRYCPEDLQTADNMARVCRMRKQVLGKQHAEILIKAKKAKVAGQAGGQSLRPLALQLRQMKQQMNKLEEVEMNFLNIASISQTTGALQTITQQYNTGHDSRENVDIDDVLDLQDALREQQETFAEIDKALAEQWTPMDSLYPSGGGPSFGPGTSREKLLEQELGKLIYLENLALSRVGCSFSSTEGYIAEAAAEDPDPPPEKTEESTEPPKLDESEESLKSLPSPPSFKDSTRIKSTSRPETGL